MKFYVTERLGPQRSLTPEGFLLCHAVPVGRVGVMDYLEEELPGVEGDRGVIRVERKEEDVFAPEAIASAAGKPMVDDHPNEDVTPKNWRELARGNMLNPRRGEGNLADVLLADILVTDEAGIEAINKGKVEVSLGYDADYEQIKPGLARQHNIRINHVALVEAGRCGPRCSIGDHAISVTLEKQMSKVIVKKPGSFKDRLMAAVANAIKSKDTAEVEKLAGEVTEDEEPIAESDLKSSTGGITINVHGNGAAPAADTKDEGGEGGEKKEEDDPFKKFSDEMRGFMKDVGERITKLEGGGSTADADGDDDDDDSNSTSDADGDDDKDDDKNKTKDGKGKTRDSAHLADTFKDALARAEILVPGIKVPTFDKKMDAKKTLDAICAFRRKALDKAYGTEDGKAAIDAITGTTKLATKDMTCDAAKLLFNAASEATRAANRASQTGSGRFRDGDIGTKKPTTIADINAAADKLWKKA